MRVQFGERFKFITQFPARTKITRYKPAQLATHNLLMQQMRDQFVARLQQEGINAHWSAADGKYAGTLVVDGPKHATATAENQLWQGLYEIISRDTTPTVLALHNHRLLMQEIPRAEEALRKAKKAHALSGRKKAASKETSAWFITERLKGLKKAVALVEEKGVMVLLRPLIQKRLRDCGLELRERQAHVLAETHRLYLEELALNPGIEPESEPLVLQLKQVGRGIENVLPDTFAPTNLEALVAEVKSRLKP